jgi:uncharacterized protein (DUF58 family)
MPRGSQVSSSVTENGFAELLDSVRGIRWPANVRPRGGNPGAHASRLRGASAEFMEYRPYRQGDYPGRIDWKLFARSDRAYIRLSNDHAVLPTMFVLDASASMAFPAKSHAKWTLAAGACIGLASVARNAGDPVGLILPDANEAIHLRPGTRQSVLQEMIRAVSGTNPGGTSSLAPVLSLISRSAARLVIISDFLGDTEALVAAAARCAVAGSEVHALHIVAVEELNPGRAYHLVRDPEDETVRRPLADTTIDEYTRRFRDWREQVAQDLATAGVFYSIGVAGDEPAEHLVRRIAAPRSLAAQ